VKKYVLETKIRTTAAKALLLSEQSCCMHADERDQTNIQLKKTCLLHVGCFYTGIDC